MEKFNKYLVVLLIAFCSAYTIDGFSQNENPVAQREVVIVKKIVDENGHETMTKEVFSGDEISEEEIERMMDVDMDGAEVEVEVEEIDERPSLGVKVAAVSGGLKVLEVVADSPAEEAGIKAGDVITAVGEQHVRSLEELTKAIDEQGFTPYVNLVRDGATVSKRVNLPKGTKTIKRVKKSIKKTSSSTSKTVERTIEKKEIKKSNPKK